MKLSLKLLAAGLGLGTALVVTPVAAQQNITIRFPVEYAANFSAGLGNQDFVKRIDELSKGRIKARFAPAGSMYKGNELVQALLRGDVEMTTVVPAYWTSVAPKVQLFDLPYAFPDYETFDRVAANRAFVSKVYADVEAKGAKVLGLMVNCYILPGTRSRQLLEPKDFQGLKLRGVGKINATTMKVLGANALSINITEMPAALQQGLVDGMQTLMDAYVEYKFYDHIKFVTDARYQLIYYPWTVNAKWWSGLSADDQKLIQQAVDDALAANRQRVIKIAEDATSQMKAKGVSIVRLSAPQEKAWQQATASVWTMTEGEIGKDLIDEFIKVRGSR
jgi:C4-dicarboxylate-binding protein DctP